MEGAAVFICYRQMHLITIYRSVFIIVASKGLSFVTVVSRVCMGHGGYMHKNDSIRTEY